MAKQPAKETPVVEALDDVGDVTEPVGEHGGAVSVGKDLDVGAIVKAFEGMHERLGKLESKQDSLFGLFQSKNNSEIEIETTGKEQGTWAKLATWLNS